MKITATGLFFFLSFFVAKTTNFSKSLIALKRGRIGEYF